MALEWPDQTFLPSWKLKLHVRFEEFDSGVLKSKVPPVIAKNLKGIKQDRAPLDAVPDPDFPGRFLLKAKVTRATLDDSIKNALSSGSSAEALSHNISGLSPKSFRRSRNRSWTADELKFSSHFT